MSNKFCTSCIQSFNALNGCFCIFLNRYVEYAKTPPCATTNNNKK